VLYKWETPPTVYDWNASKILALTHLFNIYLIIVQYLYFPISGKIKVLISNMEEYELISKSPTIDKSMDNKRQDTHDDAF
jgi:hypothetical protein